MKIVYDISVLGMGHYHSRARTGVFRVVENVACGLVKSAECELSFSASLSLETLNQSLDYLRSNSVLNDVSLFSPGAKKDIYRVIYNLITNINSQPVTFPLKVVRKLLYYAAGLLEANTQLVSVEELSRNDLFHSPFHPLPEWTKGIDNLTRFLTVYDLIPILYPQFFEFNEDHLLKKVLSSLASEDWILCISQATKDDLCNHLKTIDPSRVFVTHLAASTLFYPCSNVEQIVSMRKKYAIPNAPYFLSLSTLEPRKNIEQTVRCFARLIQEQKIKDLYLVLVGTEGWDYDRIFEEISNCGSIKDRIILTGYVDDEDLAALYSGALAFVYPSFYEGFGLPPLEAMQCGIPVITSNTSSLPEVVGGAGIMVSPTDADSLCHSMFALYDSSLLRESMSLKSLNRAKQFSWKKCTQEVIKAYRIALDS